MKKTYIIDTNVLIEDPTCLETLRNGEENEVIIPYKVLLELDNLKKDSKLSYFVSRAVRSIRENINNIKFTSKGQYESDVADIDILKEAQAYISSEEHNKENKPVLITNDQIFRMLAHIEGMESEPFHSSHPYVSESEMFTGFVEDPEDVKDDIKNYFYWKDGKTFFHKEGTDDKCIDYVHKVWGVEPKRVGKKEFDVYQNLAMELLMDDDIKLNSIQGESGSGKTFIALAVALHKFLVQEKYDRIVIIKPNIEIGNSLGFLPGDMDEKMSPYFEYLNLLISKLHRLRDAGRIFTDLKGIRFDYDPVYFRVLPMNYLRGITFDNSFVIIDECFTGNTKILTNSVDEKRGAKRIDKLVPGDIVKTFNEEYKVFENKRVLDVVCRGIKETVEVKCSNRKFTCTPDHKFLTPSGEWLPIKDCKSIIMTPKHNKKQILNVLNSDQRQVCMGSFLGDGHIDNYSKFKKRLSFCHGINQREYCEWKLSLFSSEGFYVKENGYSKKPAWRGQTKLFFMENNFPRNKEECPEWILKEMDERALAIWIMDDGTMYEKQAVISVCSFSNVDDIVDMLNTRFSVSCKKFISKGYSYIRMDKDGVALLREITSKYFHNSIKYKNEEATCDYKWNKSFESYGVGIIDYIKPNGKEEVWDIEVEDNNNFVVKTSKSGTSSNNGFVAHNCQSISRGQMRTVLSRMGQNTKAVLLGDIKQVDSPYLNKFNNGLNWSVKLLKCDPLFAHIVLKGGQIRGPICDLINRRGL